MQDYIQNQSRQRKLAREKNLTHHKARRFDGSESLRESVSDNPKSQSSCLAHLHLIHMPPLLTIVQPDRAFTTTRDIVAVIIRDELLATIDDNGQAVSRSNGLNRSRLNVMMLDVNHGRLDLRVVRMVNLMVDLMLLVDNLLMRWGRVHHLKSSRNQSNLVRAKTNVTLLGRRRRRRNLEVSSDGPLLSSGVRRRHQNRSLAITVDDMSDGGFGSRSDLREAAGLAWNVAGM